MPRLRTPRLWRRKWLLTGASLAAGAAVWCWVFLPSCRPAFARGTERRGWRAGPEYLTIWRLVVHATPPGMTAHDLKPEISFDEYERRYARTIATYRMLNPAWVGLYLHDRRRAPVCNQRLPGVRSNDPASMFWYYYDATHIWGGCFLLPLPLLLMLLTGWLWFRDRPFPDGCCPACGYDLRGSNSSRCAECGGNVPPELAREPLAREPLQNAAGDE